MKFKIDENLPIEIAQLLRSAGHEAVTVITQGLQGIDDPSLASICMREGRVLVTLDLDFADIRAYPPAGYPGMMVMRVGRQDKPHLIEVFRRAILLIDREPLEHHLWIIEENRVRIRA